MMNTPGKDLFVAATFKGLQDTSFETENFVVYFGLYQSFLHFSRREDQNILFLGSKFSFPHVDI